MTGWDAIASRWEREPWASERSPVRPPAIGAVFEAVVEACAAASTPTRRERLGARWRAITEGGAPEEAPDAPRVRVDIDGVQARVLGKRLLPRPADATFEGWHARVRREAGRRGHPARVGLIVNYPELVSPMVWAWARAAMRDLYVRVGMNNGNNFGAVFAGDYLRSAMGVHDDPESALHFPLLGRKRIRYWEPDAVDAHPDIQGSTRYDHAIAGSNTVEAGPGGVVYWPSRLWHVGEGDGELGVSLSFGLELMDPIRALAAQGLADGGIPAGETQIRFDPARWQEMAERLPDTMVCDASYSTAGLRVAWLRRLTGGNFNRLPPLAPEGAGPPPRSVQGDADWPAVWSRLDPGRAAVAANGQAALVPWSSDLPGFVATLATGEPCPVEGLRSAFPGVPVSMLVPWLLRARALSPC